MLFNEKMLLNARNEGVNVLVKLLTDCGVMKRSETACILFSFLIPLVQ